MVAREQGGVLTGLNPTHYDKAEPITLFIIQVIVIIFFTRILHFILSRFRQPRVISEVIGGIILGPSAMGNIPGFSNTIFPEEARPHLVLLANLGLILYLFIVGVELNPSALKKSARVALTISAAGIALPFALGIGVGRGLYFAMHNDNVPFSSFLLFIGVAMSITAFPVLARILSELQLIRTPVGSTALTAGVGDDVAAWVLLALVVSIINSSNALTALYIFLLTVAWILIVIIILRPILLKLIVKTGSNDDGGPTVVMMVITLSLVLISSFVTNIIGVHAIFGAFIVGVIIPHEGGFALVITEKIEDLVSVLFLPIYFALSGLKTNVGLLSDGKAWGWVILVIFVAMFGKISAVTLTARLNKFTWRESLTIGVFMSCKGLVELIVLNIGLDAGVINETIFTIMVIMALVTTVLTTPLVTWLYPHEYQRKLEQKRATRLETKSAGQESDERISKKNRLLVVLNKVEHLPAMMMLLQLLQPLSATKNGSVRKKIGEKSGNENDKSVPMTVHVLRLVELTQRISSVMKFNETEETTLYDPIMNIFRTFGQLNFVKVKANLAVVAQDFFAQQVVERAEDTGSNLVIVPWGGAGAIIDDPLNPLEEVLKPRVKKETSPQVAHFVQEIFSEVPSIANVGVFVDRGLGVSPLTTSTESGDGDISVRVFLPFFGGIDDREALSFVVQLLDHPNVSVYVLRVSKSAEPTEHDTTLKGNAFLTETESTEQNPEEIQRPSLAHKLSSASAHILRSHDARKASNDADESLLNRTFKSNSMSSNSRISYMEISSSTPLQTSIERAKSILDSKDLVVVGRGRNDVSFSHRAEFAEIHKNSGGYGNDTRKSLGDIAESFLVGGIAASILVLQAKKTTNSANEVRIV